MRAKLTSLAIPGWTTYTALLLLVLVMQAVLALVLFAFLTLRDRQSATFLPVRDARHFVEAVLPVAPRR